MLKEINVYETNWPTGGRRKPGPFDPNEIGPIAGDIVVKKGTPMFVGGGQGSKIAPRDIRLSLPEDVAEVGSAY